MSLLPPERCAACGATDLTRLPMQLTDGTPVLFVSCQVCEHRSWLSEDEAGWTALPIAEVLARSTRKV